MSDFSVGVDLEPVASFRGKPIATHRRFYARIFSAGELSECARRKDPYPGLTARFCAKEAMVKACSPIARTYVTDFQVEKSGLRPILAARRARPALRKLFAEYDIELSLSHTQEQAVAFVVVAKKGRPS